MITTKKNQAIDLDYTLIEFSEHKEDCWTLRDAVRGVQIFGGIGSGKSSGSGKTLAMKYLKMGFGGLVLTGKADETEEWLNYAKKVGRFEDVIVFGEKNRDQKWLEYLIKKRKIDQSEASTNNIKKGNSLRFNPLDYEMKRGGDGAGETNNIVNLFTSIIKMGNRISGGGSGRGDDPFWDMALQRCITSAVDLLKLAKERITIENISSVIRQAPFHESASYLNHFMDLAMAESSFNQEQDQNAKKEMEDKVEELKNWLEESYCVKCIYKALNMGLGEEEDPIFSIVTSYFLHDFATLAERTRSSITEYFYAFASPFLSGLLAKYFAKGTSEEVKPETTLEGKIIILDFPVKKYLQLGVYAQAIYKMMWQQAIERRDVNIHPNPVFLWIDEAQYFINENDMLFQTTARSSRACTVFITQNISNYYATIGGKHPKERVDSLLGNLATKIFHANNDYVTNQWAANVIGKTYVSKSTVKYGKGEEGGTISESLQYQVEPQKFTILESGGRKENEYHVQGYITVAGKKWSNGKNHSEVWFDQNIDQKLSG